MTKLTETIAYSLVSARSGRQQLEQVLREEWRAIRIAEQDRAHLATVANAPSTLRLSLNPAITIRRSVEPPVRS